MTIRQAIENDLDEILNLFYETVTSVCKADYNEEQIKVWASFAKKNQKWLDRIKKQYFLVAELDNKIVGFGSMEKGDYLDLLYIHKNYLRQGVANRLLTELEDETLRQQKYLISSDVSITARPFFEKHGYKVTKEQRNKFDNIEIINYKMTKEMPHKIGKDK